VAQIERDGLSNLSLRGIARTAGVSHAAPAHHFGDKVGLCTAIAAEGFILLASRTTPLVDQPDALLQTGVVYILFAVEHRGYFEVMFRPDLHRAEDPELVAAREKSFDVLYRVARAGAGIAEDQDVTGLAVAAWSVVHGFATLYLADNFRDQLPDDLDLAAAVVAEGVASLGRTIAAQIS